MGRFHHLARKSGGAFDAKRKQLGDDGLSSNNENKLNSIKKQK